MQIEVSNYPMKPRTEAEKEELERALLVRKTEVEESAVSLVLF